MLVVLEIYGVNIVKVFEISDLSVENIMDKLNNDDPQEPNFYVCPDLINKAEASQDVWYDLINDEDDDFIEDADFSDCEIVGEFKILTGDSVTIEGELY